MDAQTREFEITVRFVANKCGFLSTGCLAKVLWVVSVLA